MAIQMVCPGCGKTIAAPNSINQGRCPYCRATVATSATVPMAPQGKAPPPVPPPVAPAAPPAAPGGSLLGKVVALGAALVMGAVLCGAIVAAVMFVRAKREYIAENSTEVEVPEGGEVAVGVDGAVPPAGSERVLTVLKENCYRCHGEGGAAEGGFNFVLRRDKLLEENYVTPGKPGQSRLMKRMKSGEMPPEGEEPRPSAEETALVEQWIQAGASDFSAPIERTFVSDQEVYQLLRADVEAVNPRDRKFQRYFSLVHLANAEISDDELTTYRLALTKLLNSVSKNRQIVTPAEVDPQGNLLRLDLRDLKWTSETWKKLTDANPYGIVYDFADAQAVYQETGSQIPVLRGDWFVAAASRPPLYHQVLQIPATFKELLVSLNVDVDRNIAEDRVARAGFNNSGVSQNNRLIERHESGDGALWVSYDFAENTGRKNLLSHPLGPGSEDKHFLHDGGEIIFNLPNGLQGYMLVDGAGKRIDKGPTSIVSDKKRPDRAVQNGVSCMSCHFAGIIAKEDEVRAHVLANPQGFAADQEDILAVYKGNEELATLQAEDAERFQEALKKVGIERVTETNEPIVNMSIRFESNLDLKLASAELGLTPADFAAKLQSHPSLSSVLGVVNAGVPLKRDVFVKVFREAVTAFGLGTPVGKVDTPTPPPENLAQAPQGKEETTGTTPPAGPGDGSPPVQEMREWSDATGKFKVTAQFVNFDDTVVRLRKQDEKVVEVPIQQLSEPDQKFVLDQPPDITIDIPPGEGKNEPRLASNPETGDPGASPEYYGPEDYGTPPPDISDPPDDPQEVEGGPPGNLDPPVDNPGPPENAPPENAGPPVDNADPARPLFGDNEYKPPKPAYRRPRLKFAEAEPRIWTPASHEPFMGVFHDLEAGRLSIRLRNGIVLNGPLMDMSPDDRAYIAEIMGQDEYDLQSGAPPGAFERPMP